MKYKTICIVGVDGTGKSSTIESVVRTIGEDKACVQYMGAKQWETEVAQKSFVQRKYHFPFSTFMFLYAYIHEMYYRVNKHRKTGKIIVYDRYVYEHVLFREALARSIKEKVFNRILHFAFINCFPKPDKTFYLCCPLEVSLSRKDDMTTPLEIESLKRNKNILDDFYKGKTGVVVIDTSIIKQEDVIKTIIKEIEK